MLLEVQALCTAIRHRKDPMIPYKSNIDSARLYTIIAILRRHVRMKLERVNVLTNVTSGVRLREPAGDLAVAVAVASAYFDQPIVVTPIHFAIMKRVL